MKSTMLKVLAEGSGDGQMQTDKKTQGPWKQCGKCPLKKNSCHICAQEFSQGGSKIVFVFAEDPPDVQCILFANNLRRKTCLILCFLLFFMITIETWIFYF